jgi:hypothetical protein
MEKAKAIAEKVQAEAEKVKAGVEKVKDEDRVEDAQIMMMDPSRLDAIARECWELQTLEILQWIRQETSCQYGCVNKGGGRGLWCGWLSWRRG